VSWERFLTNPWAIVLLIVVVVILALWGRVQLRRAIVAREFVDFETALETLQLSKSAFWKAVEDSGLRVRLKSGRKGESIRRGDLQKLSKFVAWRYGTPTSKVPYDLTLAYTSALIGAAAGNLGSGRYGGTVAENQNWKLVTAPPLEDHPDGAHFRLYINPTPYRSLVAFWQEVNHVWAREEGTYEAVILHFLPWLKTVDRAPLEIAEELNLFDTGKIGGADFISLAAKKCAIIRQTPYDPEWVLTDLANQRPAFFLIVQTVLRDFSIEKSDVYWSSLGRS
jgi:hypothetical protein